MSTFGWGRRQCLGMMLTQDELLVACGALAWCFTIKFKVDPKTGQDIKVPLDKSNSLLIIKPDYYELAFEPRSKKKQQEIVDVWRESEERDNRERADFLRVAEAINAAAEKL
jgi:hypothetical protein